MSDRDIAVLASGNHVSALVTRDVRDSESVLSVWSELLRRWLDQIEDTDRIGLVLLLSPDMVPRLEIELNRAEDLHLCPRTTFGSDWRQFSIRGVLVGVPVQPGPPRTLVLARKGAVETNWVQTKSRGLVEARVVDDLNRVVSRGDRQTRTGRRDDPPPGTKTRRPTGPLDPVFLTRAIKGAGIILGLNRRPIQRDLALVLGVSLTTVNAWSTGRREPRRRDLYRALVRLTDLESDVERSRRTTVKDLGTILDRTIQTTEKAARDPRV